MSGGLACSFGCKDKAGRGHPWPGLCLNSEYQQKFDPDKKGLHVITDLKRLPIRSMVPDSRWTQYNMCQAIALKISGKKYNKFF
jgi:hypothetical protein